MAKAQYRTGVKTTTRGIAGSNLTAGDIFFVGGNACVAFNDALTGEEVVSDIGGVFEMPAVSGAVIAAGESVIWISASAEVDDNQATAGVGDVTGFGVAVADKSSGETSVLVALTPNVGTVS